MMRIVIISDTHGRNQNVKKVLETCGGIDYLIHLGDLCCGYYEFKDLLPCPSYIVRGNNDSSEHLPREIEAQFGKYRCLLTHGHYYGLWRGRDTLFDEAKKRGFDIVMYGHVHVPVIERRGGITVLNPGSLSFPRQEDRRPSWILMEFDDKGEAHFNINYLDTKEAEPFWLGW